VAEECSGTGGQKRGDEVRAGHQAAVPDGIDTAVKRQRVSSLHEAIDLPVG
jgi:hypothetical protein